MISEFETVLDFDVQYLNQIHSVQHSIYQDFDSLIKDEIYEQINIGYLYEFDHL